LIFEVAFHIHSHIGVLFNWLWISLKIASSILELAPVMAYHTSVTIINTAWGISDGTAIAI
jgi:hypothetical protein